MKKALIIMLTACLILTFPTLTSEAESTDNRSTLITAIVGEEFIIKIPPSLNVIYNATSTSLTMEVTKLCLAVDHILTVKPSVYTGKLISGTNILLYKLINSKAEFSTANPIVFTETGAKSLSLNITQADWNNAPAGSYSDTVTFAVAIETP